MDAFRKYLEDEGLPANEENYIQIDIPTVNLLGDTKLKVIRLKQGYDFKKSVVVNPCEDKSVFKKNHIVFQMDNEYIGELFGMIV